jgi:hypothetical protein
VQVGTLKPSQLASPLVERGAQGSAPIAAKTQIGFQNGGDKECFEPLSLAAKLD